MKTRILATIAAAVAASAAHASPSYEYTYGDDTGPHLILSSADDGTIDLIGDFVLTDVDHWDAAAEAAQGRTLTYTHSYSGNAPPTFDITYTVCQSADCQDWLRYDLYDTTSADQPAAVAFYSSPGHGIGVLYFLTGATYAVPEPATGALMLAGIGLLGAGCHRRGAPRGTAR